MDFADLQIGDVFETLSGVVAIIYGTMHFQCAPACGNEKRVHIILSNNQVAEYNAQQFNWVAAQMKFNLISRGRQIDLCIIGETGPLDPAEVWRKYPIESKVKQ